MLILAWKLKAEKQGYFSKSLFYGTTHRRDHGIVLVMESSVWFFPFLSGEEGSNL
ncbi:hypothetical protein OROGR_022887 [Orobanche gracilis]